LITRRTNTSDVNVVIFFVLMLVYHFDQLSNVKCQGQQQQHQQFATLNNQVRFQFDLFFLRIIKNKLKKKVKQKEKNVF
jgi:hypothetical protein